MFKKVFIIVTGSEFTLGIKQDKNSIYIARKCIEKGLDVIGIGISPDDKYYLQYFIKMALDKADIVIVSGGLGVTEDDVTRETISEAIGVPLIFNKDWLDFMKSMYKKYGKALDEKRKQMAKVPYGARSIENPVGTALGFIKVLDDVNKAIIALPGVPTEMKPMLDKAFGYLGLKDTKKRLEIVRTFGLMELEVEEKIKGIGEYILNATPKGVDIFLIDKKGDRLDQMLKKVRNTLGNYIYAIGEIEMEEVVGDLLKRKNLTISTAESSTGGLISSRIINVPGASKYMIGSVVAYSNDIKEKILGVKKDTLINYGAVSEETAREMALGAKKLFNTDIALSDTGIAGPTGGTEEKPVGLHYIGFAYKDLIKVEKVIFKGERNDIRMYISQYALNLVRLSII